MTHQKSHADLALDVFEHLFYPDTHLLDNLQVCLAAAKGISEFTELACGNAAFSQDELSLQTISDTAGVAVNYLKVADVLLEQLWSMQREMQQAIEEREQAN